MVLDFLENLKSYEALNPHFAKVVEFVEKTDLASLPLGRNEICGDLVYVNVMEASPKSKVIFAATWWGNSRCKSRKKFS